MNSKRTNTLIFSMFLILAIAVPAGFTSQAKAISPTQAQLTQFGQLFSNPNNVPGAIGSILGNMGGFQDNILGSIFSMIFGQVLNFSDHEILPGQNVYVFNANATGNSTGLPQQSYSQSYTTYAPYPDLKGHYYWVTESEQYNVSVTFKQAAQIVIVLWDADGSLVAAILKVLDLAKAAIAWQKSNPTNSTPPKALVQQAADTVTWLLVHINDIITGDEQIIFQPSYYWSYKITGNYDRTSTWYNASTGQTVNPANIKFANTTYDDNLATLLKPNVHIVGKTIYDSGFLFHIFQLWLRKFQVNINMAKLTSLIALGQQNSSAVSNNMLANVLEGVDVEFTFTQHHLLGGALFNDTDHNGVPTVNYLTTPYTYNDSQGVKNVTVPTTNEFRYMLDLANPGTVVVNTPQSNGTAVSWSISFLYPKLEAIPIGMNAYDAIYNNLNVTVPCDSLKFGFTFQPTTDVSVQPPAVNGKSFSEVKVNKGTIKLDQEFGNFNNGTLPAQLQGLSLCVVYFSNIFNFDLKYTNLQDPSKSAASNISVSQDSKVLNFLNASTGAYFGSIDIAGPNYTTGGNSYPASTEIVPFAFFSYTFDAQQSVQNDAFSTGQGESAFRTQSLYVGISDACAFYLVSYPHWDGHALVHDPTFSIFMTVQTQVPWGVVLLVVVIGAIALCSIALFIKNKGHVIESKK
ncbi:MAG TPA: hypothetical protein VKM55_09255 [Candidatus Lokiarchaeia archaeon]|nr:hypothetical protein [Candidatus Lokiarchaeia archaeon]